MRKDIQEFINNCNICNITKYERNPIKMTFNETPTPCEPFELIHIDVLSVEKHLFLTITDAFSKYGQAYLINAKQAIDIADKLLDYFRHHNTPKKIITDKGPELRAKVLTELCKLYNIEYHIISSNHPESNAMVERLHSTLLEHCRIYKQRSEFKGLPISTLIKYALIAYNNSVHSSTKMTPFEILAGHLENRNLTKLKEIHTTQDYITEHKTRCENL